MDNLGILKTEGTAFVMVDIQGKFKSVITGYDEVIKNANILVEIADVLELPLIITEQYPKGLGRTDESITLPDGAAVIEKTTFSCFGCDEFVHALKHYDVKTVVLFGIETHICVLQTALDLIDHGYRVHLVTDAVSSRSIENKMVGVERMKQAGVLSLIHI